MAGQSKQYKPGQKVPADKTPPRPVKVDGNVTMSKKQNGGHNAKNNSGYGQSRTR